MVLELHTVKEETYRFLINTRPFLGFNKISNEWWDVLLDRPLPSSSKFSPFTTVLILRMCSVLARDSQHYNKTGPSNFLLLQWSTYTDVGRLPISVTLAVLAWESSLVEIWNYPLLIGGKEIVTYLEKVWGKFASNPMNWYY
jgi:hypothetical protein